MNTIIVYLAVNKTNGKGYVGYSSKTLNGRKKRHEHGALAKKDEKWVKNQPFPRAIRKYGIDGFVWTVIVKDIPKKNFAVWEDWGIRAHNTHISAKKGYNCTYGGEDNPMNYKEYRDKAAAANRGRKYSDEVKKRMSEAQKGLALGRKHTEETKRKISIKHLGKKLSDETKGRISKANKGLKRSDEVRKRMSEMMMGRTHSEETKRKLSILGTGRVASKETRQKQSISMTGKMPGEKNPFYGKTHDEEMRKEMRKMKLGLYDGEGNPFHGKKHSQETRKKMSGPRKKPVKSKTLSAEKVIEVKAKFDSGSYSQHQLAKEYGVSRQQIRNIALCKTERVKKILNIK